jgi:hypothetical protein
MPEQNEGQQAATQQQERRSRRVTLWAMANGNCQQHTQTQEDQPSRSNKNKNALPPGTRPLYQNLIFGRNKTYERLLVGPPKQKTGGSCDEKI